MISHEASAQDRLDKIIKECEQIDELAEVPSFQFFQEQIQLKMAFANGRRYSKHVLIFVAELICVSPAARPAVKLRNYNNTKRKTGAWFNEQTPFQNHINLKKWYKNQFV